MCIWRAAHINLHQIIICNIIIVKSHIIIALFMLNIGSIMTSFM